MHGLVLYAGYSLNTNTLAYLKIVIHFLTEVFPHNNKMERLEQSGSADVNEP